jgi:hypothetical protein
MFIIISGFAFLDTSKDLDKSNCFYFKTEKAPTVADASLWIYLLSCREQMDFDYEISSHDGLKSIPTICFAPLDSL